MIFAKQIIKGIFIIAFFRGFLETYLKITPELSRLFCEIPIMLLMVYVFIFQFNKLKVPGFLYLLVFVLMSVVSKFANNIPLIMFVAFLRHYMIGIIFFYLILNLKFSEKDLFSIWNVVLFLIIVQIPIAVVKLLTIGAAETPMIGSIANVGGSISTILPMLGTVIFASFYFYSKSRKYLLIILGLLFCGFVGLKRAISIYLPLTFIVTFLSFHFMEKKKNVTSLLTSKGVVFIIVSAPVCFYLLVRLSPSLNEENKIWGSFNPEFTIEYMQSYETRSDFNEALANRLEGTGRYNAWQAAQSFIQTSSYSVFQGIGPGYIESSVLGGSDKALELMSLGYGVAMIGGVRIFLQIGFIGLAVFLFFHVKIFMQIMKKFKSRVHRSNTDKYIFIAVVSFFVFFTDILTYSPTMLIEPAIGFTFYFILALALKLNNSNNAIIERKYK
jgi:hypothetical protein